MATKKESLKNTPEKSRETWIWDAACSIRGAKDAPKYKDYILPLVFTKRLGLDNVEADTIGKSYEYLIRKFAEGGGQSAGEFYTPPEVGTRNWSNTRSARRHSKTTSVPFFTN